MNFGGLGKSFVYIGLMLVGMGLLMTLGPKIPGLGRLPGDIYIKRDNFVFYFPITSGIILSVLISAILNFLFRR
jgi:hypothetical protein